MEHVGIDLGATHSHLVIVSSEGGAPRRLRLATSQLPDWLQSHSPSRVVMEACTQSPAVARASVAAKHETWVIPGNVVRALGVGARGIKTDDRDAEVLAQASLRNVELPGVHLRSERSESRRELLNARSLLLEMRKSASLSIKSWLRGRLIHLKGRASSKHFCEAVRAAALAGPDGLPMSIEKLLETFEHLTDQIEKLEETIVELAEQDRVCTKLMTMPGVGPQISLALTAHLDDPKRFATSEQVASYLALVPGEATTGGKIVRTGTIKAGPGYLKALLVQGAWALWRSRPNEPIVLWARAIADKRGKRIAIVALARKMATVLWSMWKHDTCYDPTRAAALRACNPSCGIDGGSKQS